MSRRCQPLRRRGHQRQRGRDRNRGGGHADRVDVEAVDAAAVQQRAAVDQGEVAERAGEREGGAAALRVGVADQVVQLREPAGHGREVVAAERVGRTDPDLDLFAVAAAGVAVEPAVEGGLDHEAGAGEDLAEVEHGEAGVGAVRGGQSQAEELAVRGAERIERIVAAVRRTDRAVVGPVDVHSVDGSGVRRRREDSGGGKGEGGQKTEALGHDSTPERGHATTAYSFR
jgi:hypothetical protein